MPKLLSNRVSKPIDPKVYNDVKTAADAFSAAQGVPTNVPDDEVKKLLKVAETRKRIADDVFRIIEQHTGSLKALLTLDEIRKGQNAV